MFANTVQVIIPMDSGLPEDVAINTWHIATQGEKSEPHMNLALAEIEDFYQEVDAFMSREVTTVIQFKCYAENDPTPRVPWLTAVGTIAPPTTGKSVPSEVALVMSYRGVYVSGGVNARERGRVFLGPWNEDAIGSSPDLGRPAPGFIAAVATAGGNLLSASVAAAEWDWIVFSGARRLVEEEEYQGSNVISGWVDNAFDTQRRRGVSPTARSTF